jgi:hypothetical protein
VAERERTDARVLRQRAIELQERARRAREHAAAACAAAERARDKAARTLRAVGIVA